MRICPEALGLVGPGKFELDPYSKPIDPNWTLESFKESVLAAPQSLAGGEPCRSVSRGTVSVMTR